MKKKVKWILLGMLAVACAAFGVVTATAPLKVEITPIAEQTATLTFTQQGTFLYRDNYEVYPLLAGEVLEVAVKEGDAVRKGDVLATVSATDYESQIAQLESSVKGYNAQIANLAEQEQQVKEELRGTRSNIEGQLVSLQAQIESREYDEEARAQQISLQRDIVRQDRKNVEYAEDDLEYAEENLEEQEIIKYREALSTARKAYAASQLALEQLYTSETPEGYYAGQKQSLEAQLAAIDDRLGKSYNTAMTSYYTALIEGTRANIGQMREKLGQASVISPVDGVVGDLPVGKQNLINQQSPVATIGSGEAVEVFVPIREIGGIRLGDAVELVLARRGGDEIIPGFVSLIEEKAQARLSALGVEERKVRVLVTPRGPGLGIGYDVDVRFTLFRQENSLVVPKTALFSQDGADYVWAVRDGVLARQSVEKGMELREGYTVLSGLTPGDQVVTDANNQSLAEGKKAVQG